MLKPPELPMCVSFRALHVQRQKTKAEGKAAGLKVPIIEVLELPERAFESNLGFPRARKGRMFPWNHSTRVSRVMDIIARTAGNHWRFLAISI